MKKNALFLSLAFCIIMTLGLTAVPASASITATGSETHVYGKAGKFTMNDMTFVDGAPIPATISSAGDETWIELHYEGSEGSYKAYGWQYVSQESIPSDEVFDLREIVYTNGRTYPYKPGWYMIIWYPTSTRTDGVAIEFEIVASSETVYGEEGKIILNNVVFEDGEPIPATISSAGDTTWIELNYKNAEGSYKGYGWQYVSHESIPLDEVFDLRDVLYSNGRKYPFTPGQYKILWFPTDARTDGVSIEFEIAAKPESVVYGEAGKMVLNNVVFEDGEPIPATISSAGDTTWIELNYKNAEGSYKGYGWQYVGQEGMPVDEEFDLREIVYTNGHAYPFVPGQYKILWFPTDARTDGVSIEFEIVESPTEPDNPYADLPVEISLPADYTASDIVYECDDGSVVYVYSGKDIADYEAVCDFYSQGGYAVYHTTDNSKVPATTFVGNGPLAHIYLSKATGELNIVISDDAGKTLPPSTPAVTDGNYTCTVAQLMDNANVNGMSYVIQLKDGSFIVYDGSYMSQAPKLLSYLENAHTGECKPLVRAWVLTHAHNDHYPTFTYFATSNRYKDRITVEYVIFAAMNDEKYSMPDENNDDYFSTQLYEDVKGFEGAKLVFAHTGMEFTFCNLNLEILYSPENLYKNVASLGNFNDTSIVSRLYDDNYSALFLGDIGRNGTAVLKNMYGDYLKSNMCQASHHGIEAHHVTLYDVVKPQIMFYPCNLWLYDADGYGRDGKEAMEKKDYVKEILIAGCNTFVRDWGTTYADDAELLMPDYIDPNPEVPNEKTEEIHSHRLVMEKDTFVVGEAIPVIAEGSGKDWFGIQTVKEFNSGKGAAYWWYITDIGSGTEFNLINSTDGNGKTVSLPAGEYVIRLLENDLSFLNEDVVAHMYFTVVDSDAETFKKVFKTVEPTSDYVKMIEIDTSVYDSMEVYYTLDGTEPSVENGIKAEDGKHIIATENSILKAIYYLNESYVSDVYTQNIAVQEKALNRFVFVPQATLDGTDPSWKQASNNQSSVPTYYINEDGSVKFEGTLSLGGVGAVMTTDALTAADHGVVVTEFDVHGWPISKKHNTAWLGLRSTGNAGTTMTDTARFFIKLSGSEIGIKNASWGETDTLYVESGAPFDASGTEFRHITVVDDKINNVIRMFGNEYLLGTFTFSTTTNENDTVTLTTPAGKTVSRTFTASVPTDGQVYLGQAYSTDFRVKNLVVYSGNTVSEKIIMGDVNGNGKIDVYDAISILKHIAGIVILEGAALTAANVERDEVINVIDATKILKYVARLINEL